MYFYNPRSIIVYQSGGSTQQEIQNYIQDLQQKIDNLNEAIARADPGEVVVYNNGFPTGELEYDLYPIVNVGQDELFDGIQQEKINARDYFQNKLNKLQAFNRAPLVVDELSEDIVANIMRHSQRGGSTKQEMENLQQKIDTLNEAIARADPGEVVVYNNGFPTGELEYDLYPIVNVGQDELFDGIQQEKINARDYFQNKLNKLQAFNRAPLVVDELSEDVVTNIMRHSQRGGIRKPDTLHRI